MLINLRIINVQEVTMTESKIQIYFISHVAALSLDSKRMGREWEWLVAETFLSIILLRPPGYFSSVTITYYLTTIPQGIFAPHVFLSDTLPPPDFQKWLSEDGFTPFPFYHQHPDYPEVELELKYKMAMQYLGHTHKSFTTVTWNSNTTRPPYYQETLTQTKCSHSIVETLAPSP